MIQLCSKDRELEVDLIYQNHINQLGQFEV
jgi:hypothetical protein